jgi:colanic acid/amylovoran biosynthesis glycosyltransferase
MSPRGVVAEERVTVGHVNYSFFHSTQSFIYFYLACMDRVRPICLTRARESPVILERVPAELAGSLHVYRGKGVAGPLLQSGGVALRSLLTRLPSPVGERALAAFWRCLVPRLRRDDPREFADWAADALRRGGARAIHAHFGPVGWRMLGARRRLGVPLIVSFLGDEVGPTLHPWWTPWIRTGRGRPDWPRRLGELFDEAELLLAEGPYLKQRLIEMGCPPGKVEVQRIAIPTSRMPFRVRGEQPPRRPVLVFAGRFCEQKGVLYALEAVRELRREGRDLELRLIGDDTLTDGRYAARVRAYIREHRMHDCVRELGFLNHADYLRELERGDVFLHPSVVDAAGASEGGAPTTILEAQALGMPIATTWHCDIPNVTVPGVSALLVPERDGAALAEAVRTLLDHPERWAEMGRAGRRHVEERHDVTREVVGLQSRYLALLESASA